MIAAPVLDRVAGWLSGTPLEARRADPVAWAYALREAVALARPDWIVSHHDPLLEADALLGAGDDPFAVDLTAAGTPTAAAVTLVETLVALHPGRQVAVSVTGPGAIAAALAAAGALDDERDRLDAAADALPEHVAAAAAAGARQVLVWETEGGADVAAAHGPLLRRLDLLGLRPVLVAPAPIDGYAARAVALDPACFAGDGCPGWQAAADAADGAVVVTDGPIPAGADPAVLPPTHDRGASR